RALAQSGRDRDEFPARPPRPGNAGAPSPPVDEEALRALAQKLDRQLRTPDEAEPPSAPRAHVPLGVRRREIWRGLVRRWAALAAALPRPAWMGGRGVWIMGGMAALLVVGGIVAAVFWRPARHDQMVILPSTPIGPRSPTQPLPKADLATISKAMADCDAM